MKWFKHTSLISEECAKKPLEILLVLQGLAENPVSHLPKVVWAALPAGAVHRNLAECFNEWPGLQIGLPKERWGVAAALDCSGIFDRR